MEKYDILNARIELLSKYLLESLRQLEKVKKSGSSGLETCGIYSPKILEKIKLTIRYSSEISEEVYSLQATPVKEAYFTLLELIKPLREELDLLRTELESEEKNRMLRGNEFLQMLQENIEKEKEAKGNLSVEKIENKRPAPNQTKPRVVY